MGDYMDRPHVWPAPRCLADKAGQFYISRGVGEFAEYLQADGVWGRPCHYFRNEDAANRALNERPDRSTMQAGMGADGGEFGADLLARNIAAQAVASREGKRAYGQR